MASSSFEPAAFHVYRDPVQVPAFTSPACNHVVYGEDSDYRLYSSNVLNNNLKEDPKHHMKSYKISNLAIPLSDISNRVEMKTNQQHSQHISKYNNVVPSRHPFKQHHCPYFLNNQNPNSEHSRKQRNKPQDIIFDIDRDTRHDHLHVGDYVLEIVEHLRDLETRNQPTHTYMAKQRELTPELRAVLVDWFIEVSEDCQFVAETLFLMVNFVDRFMSKKTVMKHQLQLLGLASIFIASKYEEIDAITVPDLIQLSEGLYTAKQIILMEEQLLKTLKFNLNVATPRTFASRFIKIASHILDDDISIEMFPSLTYYLTELSLLHYPILKFSPSKIALACVVLALHALKKTYWNATISHFSGLKFSDIQLAMEELHLVWLAAPNMKYNIVFKKFSRNCHNRVATIPPPNLPPIDPDAMSQWTMPSLENV